MLGGLLLGGLAGCASGTNPGESESIPTFSSAARAGGATAARTDRETLLPVDCTDVISGEKMSALLGQPVDSVGVHTVLGLPAPAVGRLERMTCQYQRAKVKGASPDVEMILAAYATRAQADGQQVTNVAAERREAQSASTLSIGSAHGVLFDERVKTVLMVTSGRSSVSMTMLRGVAASDQTRAVMVDLVQRVLPNLAPEPVSESR